MMMKNLYQTPPNMSSIRAVCDSLGKTFLSLLVDNFGATGGLRLNSSPVKVKLITFPLFLPEGNAILAITPRAVCALQFTLFQNPGVDTLSVTVKGCKSFCLILDRRNQKKQYLKKKTGGSVFLKKKKHI